MWFVWLVGLMAVAFVLLHIRPLTDEEIEVLSAKRRNGEISRFFSWEHTEASVNPEFQSSMNRDGALHAISQPLKSFPAVVAALLKGKKHEWIVFAFASGQSVDLLYFNKGPDRTSVAPLLSDGQLISFARKSKAHTVLCFHNHPNAVLSPSEQDVSSADRLAGQLTPMGVSLIEFVCGRGRFAEYHRAVADSFLPLTEFRTVVRQANGESAGRNLKLHLERIL